MSLFYQSIFLFPYLCLHSSISLFLAIYLSVFLCVYPSLYRSFILSADSFFPFPFVSRSYIGIIICLRFPSFNIHLFSPCFSLTSALQSAIVLLILSSFAERPSLSTIPILQTGKIDNLRMSSSRGRVNSTFSS